MPRPKATPKIRTTGVSSGIRVGLRVALNLTKPRIKIDGEKPRSNRLSLIDGLKAAILEVLVR